MSEYSLGRQAKGLYPMDELRFDGRVAIVTGAGSGLGRAYARFLAQRGARVVVNDLGLRKSPEDPSVHPAEDTVQAILAAGGEAVAHFGDASSTADVADLVAGAVDRFGRLDIVIANAGMDHGVDFLGLTREEFERYLQVHVVGAFLLCRAAWPHMLEQRHGRILLTGSSATLGVERRAQYSAAKGGVLGLMRSLAVEGAPHGINVNAIWPFASTPMMSDAFAEATLPHDQQVALEAAAAVGLVAPVAAWLVHDTCPATGETLHAGCGKVAKVVIGQGPGITDRSLSIESIRDRWSEITEEAPTTVLRNLLDSTAWAFS
jgi:NAD(P)-dependent dehydrogenase (short-subunit alcohol dehydrogenase family)